MARIEMRFSDAGAAMCGLTGILRDLEAVEEELQRLAGQVSPAIQARYEIGPRMRACVQEARDLLDGAAQIRRVLQKGIRAYEELEEVLGQVTPEGRNITTGG